MRYFFDETEKELTNFSSINVTRRNKYFESEYFNFKGTYIVAQSLNKEVFRVKNYSSLFTSLANINQNWVQFHKTFYVCTLRKNVITCIILITKKNVFFKILNRQVLSLIFRKLGTLKVL